MATKLAATATTVAPPMDRSTPASLSLPTLDFPGLADSSPSEATAAALNKCDERSPSPLRLGKTESTEESSTVVPFRLKRVDTSSDDDSEMPTDTPTALPPGYTPTVTPTVVSGQTPTVSDTELTVTSTTKSEMIPKLPRPMTEKLDRVPLAPKESEKTRLARTMSCPVLPADACREFDAFAGDWMDSRGQPVKITPWGVIRYPRNPKLRFEADFMGPFRLRVTFDKDPAKKKFTGRLSEDCNLLTWSNDSQWRRVKLWTETDVFDDTKAPPVAEAPTVAGGRGSGSSGDGRLIASVASTGEGSSTTTTASRAGSGRRSHTVSGVSAADSAALAAATAGRRGSPTGSGRSSPTSKDGRARRMSSCLIQ